MPQATKPTDFRRLKRRRMILSFVLVLVAATVPYGYSLDSDRNLRRALGKRSGGEGSPTDSFIARMRRLFSLTDEEVQQLIFERHTSDPLEKNVSTRPPSASAAPTSAPTDSPTNRATLPPVLPESPTSSPIVPGTPDPTKQTTDISSPSAQPVGGGTIPPTGQTSGMPTVSPVSGTNSPVMFSSPPTSTPGGTLMPAGTGTIPPVGLGTSSPTSAPVIGSQQPTGQGTTVPIGTGLPTISSIPSSSGTAAPTVSPGGTLPPQGVGTGNPTQTSVPDGTFAPTPSDGTLAPSTLGTQAPVGMETVEEFLTRTLTDDGSIQISGTPQNLAFTSLTTNFPSLDPNNGQNDQTQITQIYAFNTIYFSTDGPNWRNRDGWAGSSDPCFQPTWHGVMCNSPLEGSVATAVELNLAANDLMGPLPSELRGLTSLRKFSTNCSSPPFRISKFFSLYFLVALDLQDNNLFGDFPSQINALQQLTSLDYSSNFFNGTVPTEIGQMTALLSFNAFLNFQRGSIPPQYGLLTSLQALRLDENLMTGTIPSEIGAMTSLRKCLMFETPNFTPLTTLQNFYTSEEII